MVNMATVQNKYFPKQFYLFTQAHVHALQKFNRVISTPYYYEGCIMAGHAMWLINLYSLHNPRLRLIIQNHAWIIYF